tara:strand:- start:2620 stop:3459 length:840 start_codon:yes stop_codon:yes gene_type:complete
LKNNVKNIAIQGISGSFHEEATRQFFSKNEINFTFCDTFENVFQNIKENNAIGVVAIENSLAGSILPNYGSIQSYKFNIIGETYRKIEQNLMVLKGVQLSDINEIWSHPMALRQCQEFLNDHPEIKSVEKEDTAKSAFLIKKHQLKNTAAIASETACKIYGMNILKKGIQSNKMNFTRFLVISKNKTSINQPNKATLCFSVSNTTGSLAKVLTFLAENQMNLTKIQSHPKLGKNWEYFFYIDLLFSDYNKYLNVVEQLNKYVTELSVLGAYKNGITNAL